MVDPIAAKPVSAKERPVRVAKVDGAASAAAVMPRGEAQTVASPEFGFQALARELAERPPVDAERVAKIRQAIANRTYPLFPETVADRLLALKLNWKPE